MMMPRRFSLLPREQKFVPFSDPSPVWIEIDKNKPSFALLTPLPTASHNDLQSALQVSAPPLLQAPSVTQSVTQVPPLQPVVTHNDAITELSFRGPQGATLLKLPEPPSLIVSIQQQPQGVVGQNDTMTPALLIDSRQLNPFASLTDFSFSRGPQREALSIHEPEIKFETKIEPFWTLKPSLSAGSVTTGSIATGSNTTGSFTTGSFTTGSITTHKIQGNDDQNAKTNVLWPTHFNPFGNKEDKKDQKDEPSSRAKLCGPRNESSVNIREPQETKALDSFESMSRKQGLVTTNKNKTCWERVFRPEEENIIASMFQSIQNDDYLFERATSQHDRSFFYEHQLQWISFLLSHVGAMVKSFVLESYVFEGTQCGFTSEQQHLAKTKFIQWNQMIETCFGQIHNMVKRTDASITFQHVRLHDTVRHQAAEIQVELSPWLATQPS